MNSESDDDWPNSDSESNEAPFSLAHAVSRDDDDDDDTDDIDLSSDEENDTIAPKQQQKQQLTSTAQTNIIANHSHQQQQQHVISDESLSTTTSDTHHHTKELTYEEKLDLIASQGKYLNSLVYLNRQRTVGMRSRTSRMVTTTTTTTLADHEAQDSILSTILNDIYHNHPNNDKDDDNDDDYHHGMNHSNNVFNNKQKSNKQNNSTAQQHQQQQSKFNKQFIFEDGFVRVEPLSSSLLFVLSDNVELNRSTIHDVHNANDSSYNHTLHNNNNNSDSFNRMIRDIITESSDDDDDDDSVHSSGHHHHYHHNCGSSNSNSSNGNSNSNSNSSKHEYVNGNHRNDTNSINRKRQHVTSSLPTRNSKRDSIIGSLNRPLSISLDYNLQKLLEDKLFDELNARSTTLLPVIEKKKDDKSNIMYDEDQLRLLRTLCQRMCSVHERYYSHWGQSDLEVQDVSENILNCFFLDD